MTIRVKLEGQKVVLDTWQINTKPLIKWSDFSMNIALSKELQYLRQQEDRVSKKFLMAYNAKKKFRERELFPFIFEYPNIVRHIKGEYKSTGIKYSILERAAERARAAL